MMQAWVALFPEVRAVARSDAGRRLPGADARGRRVPPSSCARPVPKPG